MDQNAIIIREVAEKSKDENRVAAILNMVFKERDMQSLDKGV